MFANTAVPVNDFFYIFFYQSAPVMGIVIRCSYYCTVYVPATPYEDQHRVPSCTAVQTRIEVNLAGYKSGKKSKVFTVLGWLPGKVLHKYCMHC